MRGYAFASSAVLFRIASHFTDIAFCIYHKRCTDIMLQVFRLDFDLLASQYSKACEKCVSDIFHRRCERNWGGPPYSSFSSLERGVNSYKISQNFSQKTSQRGVIGSSNKLSENLNELKNALKNEKKKSLRNALSK